MSSIRPFYLFTGKGGVGKTIISLAFAKYLQEQNRKVLHINFKNNSLLSHNETLEKTDSLISQLGIKHEGLALEKCLEDYISQRMNSRIIGKAVVKASFFRALINMIPGFNYLIYLGKILQIIHDAQIKGENISVVLDAPASGHTLTMLEATQNFQSIFGSGVIFDDTKKMLELLYQDNFIKINILSLPGQLAYSESIELKEKIENIHGLDTQITHNNSYYAISGLRDENIPNFLKAKLEIEKEVLHPNEEMKLIAHSLKQNPIDIVKDLVPTMKNLV